MEELVALLRENNSLLRRILKQLGQHPAGQVLFTVPQVAKLTGKTPAAIREKIDKGEIVATKRGDHRQGRYEIRKDELDRYIAAQTSAPMSTISTSSRTTSKKAI